MLIFGIAEEAGMGMVEGERALVPDVRGHLTTTSEKRPVSPQAVQSSAKQPKLDNYCGNSDGESTHSSTSQESSKRSFAESFTLESQMEIEEAGREVIAIGTAVEEAKVMEIVPTVNEESTANEKSSFDEKELIKRFQLKELSIRLDREECTNYKPDKDTKGKKKKNEQCWEVEKIIDKTYESGKPKYYIKWKGWDAEFNTWEPASNLVNCTELLEEFENDRIKLVDSFKETATFNPTDKDIELFAQNMVKGGGDLDSFSFLEDKFFGKLRRYMKKTKKDENGKEHKQIEEGIMKLMLTNARRQQLESLCDWENEMNGVAKGKPSIRVENYVDIERAPMDFYYIENYLPGAGVEIPDDPPIFCQCEECSPKSACCFREQGSEFVKFAYDKKGKIKAPPGTPIFECNKRCKCSPNCRNRVVQKGTEAKLCIFRTDNGRGWGVKTLKDIASGSFVTQYVGEVIKNDEAEKRGKEYDAAGRTYLFDLDYNSTDNEDQCPYTVDAAVYGNVSHFINHSCDPNLAVFAVWIDCLDPNLPKLALFAKRKIAKNEELTFDYLCQSSKKTQDQSMKEKQSPDDTKTEDARQEEATQSRDNTAATDVPQRLDVATENEDETQANRTLCKCNSSQCRKYLF